MRSLISSAAKQTGESSSRPESAAGSFYAPGQTYKRRLFALPAARDATLTVAVVGVGLPAPAVPAGVDVAVAAAGVSVAVAEGGPPVFGGVGGTTTVVGVLLAAAV